MLSEAKDLLDLIGTLRGWVAEVIRQRKADREHRAADLLATAGILVAALRTLDNGFRGAMADLRLFDAGWDDATRARVRDRLNRFAEQELILPHVRQSLAALTQNVERGDLPGGQAALVRELIGCGNRLREALGSDVTPFPSVTVLAEFLARVGDARTAVEAEAVRNSAQRHLAVLDRRILAQADMAFGRLRDEVMAAHPGLPEPGWAVAL